MVYGVFEENCDWCIVEPLFSHLPVVWFVYYGRDMGTRIQYGYYHTHRL